MIGVDVARLSKFNGPSPKRKERRVTPLTLILSASAIYVLRGLSEEIIGVGTFCYATTVYFHLSSRGQYFRALIASKNEFHERISNIDSLLSARTIPPAD